MRIDEFEMLISDAKTLGADRVVFRSGLKDQGGTVHDLAGAIVKHRGERWLEFRANDDESRRKENLKLMLDYGLISREVYVELLVRQAADDAATLGRAVIAWEPSTTIREGDRVAIKMPTGMVEHWRLENGCLVSE